MTFCYPTQARTSIQLQTRSDMKCASRWSGRTSSQMSRHCDCTHLKGIHRLSVRVIGNDGKPIEDFHDQKMHKGSESWVVLSRDGLKLEPSRYAQFGVGAVGWALRPDIPR